jgi:hypothetical protein
MNNIKPEIIDKLFADLDAQTVDNDVSNRDPLPVQQKYIDTINKILNKVKNRYSGDSRDLMSRLSRIDVSDKTSDQKDVLDSLRNGTNDFANYRGSSQQAVANDINMICTQFPEMDRVVQLINNAVAEVDVNSGKLKLIAVCDAPDIDPEEYMDKLDVKFRLRHKLKTTMMPQTFKFGEGYSYIAEYKDILNHQQNSRDDKNESVSLYESMVIIPNKGKKNKSHYYPESADMKSLYESALSITKNDLEISSTETKNLVDNVLDSIIIRETMYDEIAAQYGKDWVENVITKDNIHDQTMFEKYLNEGNLDGVSDIAQKNILSTLTDNKDSNGKPIPNVYAKVKGCYFRWIPSTDLLPCRVGETILGYYYINKNNTRDLQNRKSFANGVIDLSMTAKITSEQSFVAKLSNIITAQLGKPFIAKNMDFIHDIVEVIMEHDFSKSIISVTFIPVDNIIPMKINENVDGIGESVLQKALFTARMRTMLLLSGIITLLNNRPTRNYFIKRSPTNNNISKTIQEFKQKLQSKRVGINDVNGNYTGTINKIGGISDIVLPVNSNGDAPYIKEYDNGATIDLHEELLDMLYKQALNQTPVPATMVDASVQMDYSRQAEIAQTEFASYIFGAKLELSQWLTDLYKGLIHHEFDIPMEKLTTFRVSLPTQTSQELAITSDMINNFNTSADFTQSLMFDDSEIKDPDGKPNAISRRYRRLLAEEQLPQFNFKRLQKIKDDAMFKAKGDEIETQISTYTDFSDLEDE